MKFKVLTFNAGLCRVEKLGVTWAHPAPFIEERLSALPNALIAREADVICLQEVFKDEHRVFVADQLKTEGYDCARTSLYNGWPNDGHGLMILARRPLYGADFHPFTGSSMLEGLVTKKGLLTSKLTVLGFGTMVVGNAHLVSGIEPESADVQRIRSQQIRQIVSALRSVAFPHLLAADLNAGPRSSIANYEQLILSDYVDTLPMDAPPTWDRMNVLTQGPHEDMPSQRIDGIFLKPYRRIQIIESCVTLNDRPVTVGRDRVVALSDHYAVETTFELS